MNKLIFILFLFISSLSCGQGNFFWSHTFVESEMTVKYGYLYNWYVVDDAREIAPVGWHVITRDEIINLSLYYDATTDTSVYGNISILSGEPLKETGINYWVSPNSFSTNESKLNLRGSGSRLYDNGTFSGITSFCQIWSQSTYNGYPVYMRVIVQSAVFVRSNYSHKEGMSIRLVKDSTTLSHGDIGIMIGNDDKKYRTICINGVEIIADNLCETKYRNGDWITGYDSGVYTPISDENWAAKTTGAMCAYGDDETNAINE